MIEGIRGCLGTFKWRNLTWKIQQNRGCLVKSREGVPTLLVGMYATSMETSMEIPQKLKTELPYDMAILLVLYIQDNWKDSCRYLYTHIHNSTIHNNQKVEAIQVSMMDE